MNTELKFIGKLENGVVALEGVQLVPVKPSLADSMAFFISSLLVLGQLITINRH